MIRFLIIRLIIPLLLLWFARALFKSLFASMRTVTRPSGEKPHVRTGGELRKDPVCGTFVPVDTSVTKTVDGETIHFCSVTCRDKYS